ncbi:MAG: S-methyl-5-thioribose-1-phosphate isomerase [Candidatus Omnitrophota bacterium]
MKLETIAWKQGAIKLIDQTKLPGKLSYIRCTTVKQVWEAIHVLKVRGAPAIGAAAALGMVLGINKKKYTGFIDFKKTVDELFTYLASSRPTAVNLVWALERTRQRALQDKSKKIEQIKKDVLDEAMAIINEDKTSCRKMADNAQSLIKNNDRILTICNAGFLATVDYGTALGCLYRAKELRKKLKVYSCETRPLLQGARLTCWELKQKGMDVTLLCDNMAGYLMQQKKIDKIFIGADRIAGNGDSANKIGSYSLSVLAKFHKIPFYVVAPRSTFDFSLKSGKEIPIEQRDKKEVTELFFKHPITAKGVNVYNPAFDVVPHELISGIITEFGVLKPPFKGNITQLMKL